jgi:hypothetical protein
VPRRDRGRPGSGSRFRCACGRGKTAAQCNAEYAANQAAIKASGQTKRAFVTAWRSGTETIPTTAAAPPLRPPAPAPLAPAQHVGATGAGGFATDAPLRNGRIVYTRSGIYRFVGTHNYGNTKKGTYMCEADAKAAGDRAAENEKRTRSVQTFGRGTCRPRLLLRVFERFATSSDQCATIA